jgi:HD-GYP domain-containing protein (c-di-GMP phosphodiesterase class II)
MSVTETKETIDDNIEDLEPLELIEDLEEFQESETIESIGSSEDETSLILPQHISFDVIAGSSVPTAVTSRHLILQFQNYAFQELFPESALGDSIGKLLASSLSLTELRELIEEIEQTFQTKQEKGKELSVRRYFHLYSKDQLPKDIVLMISLLTDELLFIYVDDVTVEHRKLLRGTFLSLLEASKLKDNDTGNHIKRVGEFAKMVAESLSEDSRYSDQVTPGFIDAIHFLAPMHDVGKIGTPDDILNKEGPLDAKEWEIMKEHTINGAYILASYPDVMAKQIALHHHERWDGNGYPYSLAGEMIPLASRIVSIADVYDALRMRRSYKAAMDHETASSIIRQGKNTQFDPGLTDHFIKLEGAFKQVVDSLQDEYQ